MCLHSRKDHDDRHNGPQQQKEGENQPSDSGVIGGGTAATQKTWCRATQTGGLRVMERMAKEWEEKNKES